MSIQELNLKLVKEVKKRDVLYNYTLPGYSRKELTDRAWQEVAAKVNMSAAECKHKWRNLRTVFMRKMKPRPSGFVGKKRAYYLENAMQFCLPFLKTLAPHLTETLPQQQLTDDVEHTSEIEVKEEVCVPQSSPVLTELFAETSNESCESSNEPPQTSSPCNNVQKGNEKTASVANVCVTEPSNPKKAKLHTSAESDGNRIDRQESTKMFLLSLLPELEELSDDQIKVFKRQVFRVIDDITASGHQPQTSSGVSTLVSTSLSNSIASQVSSDVLPQTRPIEFCNTISQGFSFGV